MYKALFVVNALIWLALLIRYVTKYRPSEFHPANAYIAVHGILFVILPIFFSVIESNFNSLLNDFGPSERTTTLLTLGSLFLATGLQWAQKHHYNLDQEQWTFIIFFGLSSLLVFLAAIVFPIVVGGFFDSIRTRSYWL